jgi:hypothetical protein
LSELSVGLRIKSIFAPSISPEFYNQTDRVESSNMVSKLGGLEFEPWSHIFRCV